MSGRWEDIQAAAQALGISTEAVRKRIQRGKLLSERRQDKLQVWLDADLTESEPEPQVQPTEVIEAKDEAIRDLRDQVEYLRSQLDAEREARTEERRRHDILLAQLMQRIPELEASGATEPRGSSETN